MDSYITKYTDSQGSEDTIISNDGRMLRVRIRGIEFSGTNFDSFEPSEEVTAAQLSLFTLEHNELCSCRFEFEIPILMSHLDSPSNGTLSVVLILGDPRPTGGIDREELQITLTCEWGRFSGSGKSGWFEDELLEIQSQLPPDVYMKTCINCLYSDYSPAGHGAFGCMLCFRNLKSEYLAVKTKSDFWPVLNCTDICVQETYLCPEFTRRIRGTGYRG